MTDKVYFGSRVRAGSVSSDSPPSALTATGVGDVSLSQTALLVATASGNTDASVVLPAGAQITRIDAAVQVVPAGGTATTLLVTAGSAAGGVQYLPSTDLYSATNATGPSTVATNLAASNITTNTTVHFRVAANGTMTTAGQVRFTVFYAMRS